MDMIDPVVATAISGTGIATWWFFRWFFNRSVHRVDDIEQRLKRLEENGATHDDIKQIRDAIESGNRSIHARIDGIYKLFAEKK